jgi:hypothetical protein
MQVQIKFIARGSSSVTGNFAPGDLLRCSAEHARHLVDEAQCAVYTSPPAADAPLDQPTKPRAARKTAHKDQA